MGTIYRHAGFGEWISLLLAIGFLFCVCLPTKAQLPAPSFYHIDGDQRLHSSGFNSIAEDPYGFIWFGSYFGGGIYRFDGYDIRSFVVDPDRKHASLPSNKINTIVNYDEDYLCMGTHAGLAMLNLVDGSFQSFMDDSSAVPDISALYVEPILPDSLHDCIWVGGGYGLVRFSMPNKSFVYLSSEERPGQPDVREIIDIVQDIANPDILWLGTKAGLFSYHIKEDRFSGYGSEINSDVILDLYQDTEGVLWLAIGDKQNAHRPWVMSYRPSNNVWRRYDLGEEDAAGTAVYYIMGSLAPNTLWVSTLERVGLLNTQSGEFQAWEYMASNPDGLLSKGAFRTMMGDRHGRLWISSWQGIQYAKAAYVSPARNVLEPKVCITDITTPNLPADAIKPLYYFGPVALSKDQRDVTIRYVLPNPLDPNAVTYQYMLKGRDKDWITTDQRAVQYTGLNGEEFQFLIRAKEGDGAWTPVTELPVTVEKQIYEYAWFWILALGLVIGLMILLYRFLIGRAHKAAQRKADFERKVSEIEMQALRAQMNPHFLFNSLNSIKYYAISKDSEATAEYLSKFALLVRTILNNSKSRTISLKDELEALRLYIEIEHLRLEGSFEYQIDIDSSLRVEQAQIPPMVLQPYVENAIWHGLMHKNGGGKLSIQVKDLGEKIQCIIEDNGIGRDKARALQVENHRHKKSVGMQITADRIALINKIYNIDTQVQVVDLHDRQGNPSGTRVVINIPVIADSDE